MSEFPPQLSTAERSRKNGLGSGNWNSSKKAAFSRVMGMGVNLPSLSPVSVFPQFLRPRADHSSLVT